MKRLVEMHGGTIHAESAGLNQGSTFTVRLPLAQEDEQPVALHDMPDESRSGAALRVLVVDDNVASAKTTGWMLELIGHEFTLAHDGVEALEMVKKLKPDVVLLDIGLPGMNGYEVCRNLRANPEYRNTVLIAQTGWGQERDRQQARGAGFDHHLVKPVNFEEFSKLLGGLAKAPIAFLSARRFSLLMTIFWEILKETCREWWDDKAPRLGAALAFYTVLALGPLLVIVIAISGMIFGPEAAAGKITAQIEGWIGQEGARVIQDVLASSREKDPGLLATIVGIGTLFIGASGVFGQLQDALNTIWNATPRPGRSIIGLITERFLSFAMVLGTGFLLLVSLVISTALAVMGTYFTGWLPALAPLLELVNIVASFAVTTLLFALIYKVLPDVKLEWRDVWIGAVFTSALFTIGKTLIGFYIGQQAFNASYGAAGSLVALLIWVYYSAQILFFGAELTQVYSRKFRES